MGSVKLWGEIKRAESVQGSHPMEVFMGKFLIAVLTVVAIVGCTKPDDARRVLAAHGYTDISITGYRWFSCSKDDTYHTGFVATSPAGIRVEGCVCDGFLFKNATIRFK